MKIVPQFLNEVSSRKNVIFRGHADYDWELKPSIGRDFSRDWKEVLNLEIESLAEFKKRSLPHLKTRPSSDIEWLCLMQHHGCSTRLLDFTSNPLIALFFASDPTITKDGAVIEAKYGRTYENVSDANLFEREHSFAYYPPHITERIIGQSGCFVYAATPNHTLSSKQIKKIRIPKRDKFYIRRELQELGICQSSLFPGLDGICRDLNDTLIEKIELEDLF